MILSFFDKLTEFGENIYKYTIGFLSDLPAFGRAILTILLMVLAALGLLSLLKKSFKIFGLIIIGIIVFAIVSMFIVK